jgi:hypothetical protein
MSVEVGRTVCAGRFAFFEAALALEVAFGAVFVPFLMEYLAEREAAAVLRLALVVVLALAFVLALVFALVLDTFFAI